MAESGLFNLATIRRLVEQHESGKRDHSTPIWTLLMFDAFLKNVIDETAPSQLRGIAAR